MFEGATPVIFENAKQLRQNMTAAEMALWLHLRKGIQGAKFRRQHPIGIYIADFYCHKAKLIIEVDGSVHNDPDVKANDEIRQQELEKWGYEVIRFSNQEVLSGTDTVLEKISNKVNYIINNQTPNNGV